MKNHNTPPLPKNADQTTSTEDTLNLTDYAQGFETNIDMEYAPKGLTVDTIKHISKMKNEPEFILEWRLKAFAHFITLKEPHWSTIHYGPLDYQEMIYFAKPKSVASENDLTNKTKIDPELIKTYEKLGIPLKERDILLGISPSPSFSDSTSPVSSSKTSSHSITNTGFIAVDAVFDSVSLITTYQEPLKKLGILFCSISEALQTHPELVQKYLGTVVPYRDNFFACLNSATFTDGTFCYIPKGVRCPMELSTYFRINAKNTGQFERTLIIADEDSYVSYLEGCSAPMRDSHQLHAAVVELIALKGATIQYATVQNWYPGDPNGQGGIYNFVTKRGLCEGEHARISWTQVETGAIKTWKYPSVILKGDHSVGEFYSIAVSRYHQEADTGTKMIHIGNGTKSTILSKGISADYGSNTYRGLVHIYPFAQNCQNFSQCDSLIFGDKAVANTYPTLQVDNGTAEVAHEATTTKISEENISYLMQRNLSREQAIQLIVGGFCKSIYERLPMEFAVESMRLIELCLEQSTG